VGKASREGREGEEEEAGRGQEEEEEEEEWAKGKAYRLVRQVEETYIDDYKYNNNY
jgi:hypothetical protein